MKKLIHILFLIFVFNSVLFCQSGFQQFIDRVNSVNTAQEKSAIIDSFMIHARSVGIPYMEDTTVNFIYLYEPLVPKPKKDYNTVSVPEYIYLELYGATRYLMNNLTNTNFLYFTKKFESDARLDYRFIVEDNIILDSENPLKIIGNSFGEIFSELRMPSFQYPVEIDYNPSIPHGTREKTVLHSDLLQWDFDIEVYLPPSYYSNSEKKYPVSYQQDGQNLYKTVIGTMNVLDNLVYQNKIEEIILVGIHSYLENRTEFYTKSKTEEYESFVVNQVLPYIESTYRVIDNPKSRNIGGVSAGGTIAGQIAYNHPNLFGLCMLVSPGGINSVFDTIVNGVKKDIKFYYDWGSYETGVKTFGREFRDKMLAKNCELEWHEWHDGHVYGNFRAHQDNAYMFLFPSKNATGINNAKEKIDECYTLFQNNPNPFNPSTKIKYSISSSTEMKHTSSVQLKVYDVLGREVATLVNERKQPGEYEVEFNAASLPSGVYFYQLKAVPFGRQAVEFIQTKKMILLK